MFSSNVIVDNALRWALFGAAVGGAAGAVRGFSSKRRAAAALRAAEAAPSPAARPADLDLDPEVAAAVGALDEFRPHHPASLDGLYRHGAELSRLNTEVLGAASPTFSLSTRAAKATSAMIECVRNLRAHFVDSRPAVQLVEQFDDAAGAIQKLCNDYMHNITMTVQCKK